MWLEPANMTLEPGLDRHEWESEFASLEEDLTDDPYGALPQFADLVERMLTERGYDLADTVARAGEEREVVADYLSARETSDRIERDENVDPGDVATAINNLREVFDFLLVERETP
jgi:hypothetical protein